jgi:hypothetical protein
MRKILTILKKTWYWSYERGSWQYDVMCVLILAFIFLVPARVFDDPEARPRWATSLEERTVPVAEAGGGSVEELSAVVGAPVHRVEVVRESGGRVTAYKVWSRRAEE